MHRKYTELKGDTYLTRKKIGWKQPWLCDIDKIFGVGQLVAWYSYNDE